MTTLPDTETLNNDEAVSEEIAAALRDSYEDYRTNSLWRLMLRRVLRQRSAIVGMIILSFLIAVAVFAPVIAPYDPEQVLIGIEDVKKRAAPCIHLLGCPKDEPQHLMGTDGNVRDRKSVV